MVANMLASLAKAFLLDVFNKYPPITVNDQRAKLKLFDYSCQPTDSMNWDALIFVR